MIHKSELLGYGHHSSEYPLEENDRAIRRAAYHELWVWCRRYKGGEEFQELIRLIEQRLQFLRPT